jgi:hypothetical protein
VVDVEAKAFKGLAGSVFILSLANVVGLFAGLREVPVLRPEHYKEVKASYSRYYKVYSTLKRSRDGQSADGFTRNCIIYCFSPSAINTHHF